MQWRSRGCSPLDHHHHHRLRRCPPPVVATSTRQPLITTTTTTFSHSTVRYRWSVRFTRHRHLRSSNSSSDHHRHQTTRPLHCHHLHHHHHHQPLPTDNLTTCPSLAPPPPRPLLRHPSALTLPTLSLTPLSPTITLNIVTNQYPTSTIFRVRTTKRTQTTSRTERTWRTSWATYRRAANPSTTANCSSKLPSC